MKHGRWQRMAAVALAVCLSAGVATPANALSWSSSGSSSSWWNSWTDSWNNFWDGIFGGSEQEQGGTLTLVENETTVTEGTELRADTYALEQRAATTLKYFPVTLYDYDTKTINDATHQVEVDDNSDLRTWNGIYFNGGTPGAESYTYSTDGTVNYEQKQNGSIYWRSLASQDTDGWEKTAYYIQLKSDGQYYPAYIKRETSGYIFRTTTCSLGYETKEGVTTITSAENPSRKNCPTGNNNTSVTTTTNGYIALYQPSSGGTKTVGPLPYARWNWWNKNTNDNKYGQYTYSGLVKPTLDDNKNIQFTKPEGGIFDKNAEVKKIYTNVDMPFVYNSDTKYYTFDASQNGVYFKEDSSQGSTAAQSDGRLYLDQNQPQKNNTEYGDGSKTVWMPFNSTRTMSEGDCNYHFGMVATIPFTMTANGKMNPNDDNSDDIEFSFSGDDDVWVFIDGQLVLDIGGIHNRLDGTINFADNTWSLSESNAVDVSVQDYNGKAISGKLFNEGDQTGTLGQTLSTFAAKESHELTIFYLERGQGSSNCKIQFNLPMKDTVSVTKQANQSITNGGQIDPLTAAEQERVDAIDFGFTLYKDGVPVANTNYNLLNANGQIIGTPSTDRYGHFTLKNGQTARFVGEIATDGSQYRVVEDRVEADLFSRTDYSYSGTAAGGFTVNDTYYSSGDRIPDTEENLTSETVTARGSDEAEDSLVFVCTNYLNANLPNPSARPQDDRIVLDYGLSVEIDVLSNDVYRGDQIEITDVDVTGAQYGTAEIQNGKIIYTPTEQLTGVEVLTYTVTVTATGNSGDETTTDTDTRTAKVYIIPATTMYYEENFTGLVTFSDGWTVEDNDTADTYQEPGVVGTVGDSPYGSDVAYLKDSGDSNGTSKWVDTTGSSASFSYTFTGTGTSFFARTSANSAVISVKVVNHETGEQIAYQTRNTKYVAEEGSSITGPLYNIPVYTISDLDYGTYDVEVTVLKAVSILGYGNEFYLDGIRVVSPLNLDDVNVDVAEAAYAQDGEAGMTMATLRLKLLANATHEGEDGSLVWNDERFVVFTDSNGEITDASEYQSNGPKEEVYLYDGQSVTFSLANWDPDANNIYLGIKAPAGTGSVQIGTHILNIQNSTDCYYEISDYGDITEVNGVPVVTFKITAGQDCLISVTNIKVTGDPDFVIVTGADIEAGGDSGENTVVE